MVIGVVNESEAIAAEIRLQPYDSPSMGSHSVGHDWSDLAAAADSLQDPLCFEFFNFYPTRHIILHVTKYVILHVTK